MQKYSYDIHAKVLLHMLYLENPCSSDNCPHGLVDDLDDNMFDYSIDIEFPYHKSFSCQCPLTNICRSFIGLSEEFSGLPCPCQDIGKDEAIKRTWKALEDKGYLE